MREKIGEVTLHLTINNQPLKSGKHTICIRVQHKNANRYYSTHCEMSKSEWKRFEKSPDSDHPAMTTYRTFLEAIKSLVRDNAFSFANLSQATNRSRGNHIQEILLEHTLQLRRDGKHNTADMYNNLYVCVNEFLKGKPTPITSFGPDTCRSFVRWLTDKRHNNPTTVAIKMRNLTAVMNRAIEAKMITRNPMNGIRKPQPRRRDLSISPESLKKILSVGPSDLPDDTYFWLLHWRALYYGNGMNASKTALMVYEDKNDIYKGFTEVTDMVIIDYPGYGVNDGVPSSDTLKEMALTSYDEAAPWATTSEVISFGYSIGTGPATYLASQREVGGLILWAPYANTYDLYNNYIDIFHGPFKLMVTYKMDNYKYIKSVTCPTLILATDTDEEVPYQSSRDLFTNSGSTVSDFVTIQGITHNDFWTNDKSLDNTFEFIRLIWEVS